MKQNLKIFIAGYDVMGRNMAGPGIRSLAIATFLSKHTNVTLSHDSESDFDNVLTGIILINEKDVAWDDEKFWRGYDLAIMPGTQTLKTPLPKTFPIPLYVDIYDPFILENLELLADKTAQIRNYEYTRHLRAMLEMLLRGDRFIVTGERTRDFFTGMLSAWGIINPITASGEKFDELFLTISFGIPDEPFENIRAASDESLPEYISENDELIIWAGGLWDWLEPLKAVDAIPSVLKERPDAKLVFMGYRHPNKHIPLMESAKQCIEKSKKMKLFGDRIIFNEWTPYAKRIPILGRADLGLSLHRKHMETRYAFRTRIMDYIWAEVPMAISGGDSLALDLEMPGVEILEPGSNSDIVANAILKNLDKYSGKKNRKELSDGFKRVKEKYRWSEVLKPFLKSIEKAGKLNSDFYTQSFMKLLESFPDVSRPGIITRGIDKIKRGI